MSDQAAAAREVLAEAEQKRLTATRIRGGRRCGIRQCEWLDDWWVAYSPRNGDDAVSEGSWDDWVSLAQSILEGNARRVADR